MCQILCQSGVYCFWAEPRRANWILAVKYLFVNYVLISCIYITKNKIPRKLNTKFFKKKNTDFLDETIFFNSSIYIVKFCGMGNEALSIARFIWCYFMQFMCIIGYWRIFVNPIFLPWQAEKRNMGDRQVVDQQHMGDPQLPSSPPSKDDMVSCVMALEAALLPCLPARELQAIDRSPHPSHQSG